MKTVFMILGAMMLLMGIFVLIYPDPIFEWIRNGLENDSMYTLSTIGRIFTGILFLVAAKQSRFSRTVFFLGCLALLTATIFFFMGRKNFQVFFIEMLPQFRTYAAVSGLIDMAFGAFLIYAFTGERDGKN